MPEATPPVNRYRRSSSRSNYNSAVLAIISVAFDTSSVVPLRSSSCLSPDPVIAGPFPYALTTMAFDHSRQRWFETSACTPVPRGPPSSVEQLRTRKHFCIPCSWHTIVDYTSMWNHAGRAPFF